MQNYWSYIGIVLFIFCSAFFSSAEIAYASANKLRLKKANESGDIKGKWAYFISENNSKALCTLLIGNNLVNIAVSSVSTVIAISLLGSAGVAYATGIMTVLLLIFGEIVPKQLAKQIINIALDSPFSRIPVYEGSIDNIIGVLSLNHLLKNLSKEQKISDIRFMLTEVSFVHKSKELPVILDEMRRKKIHMVVVTDDYGGTLGVLSMEDILEQLVGDIWDETDKICNDFVKISENDYEVNADVGIHEFLAYFHIKDDELEEDFLTLGGWSIEMFGRFPKQDDSFEYKNLRVTAVEMDELRVIKLCVQVK